MKTYILYTTKSNSYIVPKDKFEAKQYSHSYEIDTGAELCSRKTKLPVRITDGSQIGDVLKLLCVEVPHGEDAASNTEEGKGQG